MGVAFAQASLNQYRRDDTGLFQIPNLAEESQSDAFLRANISGGADPIGKHSGKEEVSDAVEGREADEEYWYLVGVITAAEGNGKGFRGEFRVL